MAFITKRKKRYQVRHGVTGQRISSHSSRQAAKAKRDRLHRENKPKARNRGASARSRYRSRRRR